MRRFAVIILALLFLVSCEGRANDKSGEAKDGMFKIPVATIKDGMPEFHTYKFEDTKIRFFVFSLDNEVQAYFDACAKCYVKKAGYRFKNGRIYCNSCDVAYSIRSLKTGIGKCYPLPLKGTLSGTDFIINKSDIINGSRYF